MILNFIFSFLNLIILSVVCIVGLPIVKVLSFLLPIKGNKQFPKPKSIAITGGSSGLGKSLAINYAEKGVNLCLFDLNETGLKQVKLICEEKGAKVEMFIADITDKNEMKKQILNFNERNPIDLLIANAGVIESQLGNNKNFDEKTYILTDVNVIGMLNTVLPVIPCMEERGTGQIAIMSSMSSDFSTFYPSYSASKSYCATFGKSLRNRLQESGVGVTVIMPGFIKTPMTESFKKSYIPFEQTLESSTINIMDGIKYNKSLVVFPWAFKFLAQLLYLLPPDLFDTYNFLSSIIFKDLNLSNYGREKKIN